jgi:ABC-type antimicrobial peptide transport system permease subunit
MEILTLSKKALFKNKISVCLILSVSAIAVCCLILLFGINEAGKKEIAKSIKERGNIDKVNLDHFVFTEKGMVKGGVKAVLSPNDLRLIKNSCREVKGISFYSMADIDGMKIGKKQYSITDFRYFPQVYGVPPEHIKVIGMKLKEGRFINKTDMLYKRRVCVLGGEVDRFVGQKNLIGKKIITKNPDEKFTIIGILHRKMPLSTILPQNISVVWEDTVWRLSGRPMYTKIEPIKGEATNLNCAIYIPFAMWEDFNKRRDNSFGGIILESETFDNSLYLPPSFPEKTLITIEIDTSSFEEEDGEKIIKDEETARVFGEDDSLIYKKFKQPFDNIRLVLRKRYGDNSFFRFGYCSTLIDELNGQMEDSRKLLMVIFLSSLLLSGIILMSMQLLSVYRRISEIGVLRAFGARKKDIFWQFLAEGVMLYSIGIVIGIFTGTLASYLMVTKIAGWEFSIPIFGIISSSLFVFLVGILSGLYPALKAANIPPAEAVKYE